MAIGISGAVIAANLNYQAPATGATIVMGNDDYVLLVDPAASIANLTIQMCPTPLALQIIHIIISRAVTTLLTISPNSGQSIVGYTNAPSVAGVHFFAVWRPTGWYF